MGNLCSSCFGGSSGESTQILTPNVEERRREMAEAAERRIQEQERKVKNIENFPMFTKKSYLKFSRSFFVQGIKNPESVKRNQQKAAEVDRMRETQTGDFNLKWSQN